MNRSNPLAAIIGGMMEQAAENARQTPSPLPEAQVATLREIYERYAAGCAFKPGDFVTPRACYAQHNAGSPHVVVEVANEPFRNFEAADPHDVGCNAFGARLDMRVVCFMSDHVAAFWVESWKYEPYTGAGA